MEEEPAPAPVGGGVKEAGRAKQRSKKAGSQASENFSADGTYLPKIKQWRRVWKKEQVKGCGSVNRPHPVHSARQSRSLRAFSGFSTGRKSVGRQKGLGVKLWVVGARFSQR